MRSAALFSLLAGLAAAAPTTSIEALNLARSIVARAPPGANAVLKSVTSSGTGCNPNTAQFVYNDQASVVFDSMVVSAEDKTKTCVIEYDIELDPAWKYTVGVSGVFQGWGQNAKFRLNLLWQLGGESTSVNILSPVLNGDVDFNHGNNAGVTSPYGGGKTRMTVDLTLTSEQEAVLSLDSYDMNFAYSQ